MKRIFAVVFALAIFGLGGVARAAEESPVVAQAEAPAHSGDNRPAMLNDIRDAETRINARIDGMETRMDARMDGMEARMDARMDGVEARMSRMEARMSGMEARMSGMETNIQSLSDDIRVVHTGLYAIFGVLLVIVLGGLFTIITVLFRERRNALISGAATMAFALIAGAAFFLSAE